MVQVAWVVGSLFCLYRAVEAAEDDASAWRQQAWWLAALLCVAGGVLTKWTAPAFFYLTAIPWLWWRGRWRLLFSRPHLIAAFVAGALCLLWIGAVVSRVGWELFVDTLRRKHCRNCCRGNAIVPRRGTMGHCIRCLFLEGLSPWSALAFVTLRPAFLRLWNPGERRLLQLLHCWTWPNLVFWSVVPNHATRHSLPLVRGWSASARLSSSPGSMAECAGRFASSRRVSAWSRWC